MTLGEEHLSLALREINERTNLGTFFFFIHYSMRRLIVQHFYFVKLIMKKKQEFKVEPIHANKIPYNPLVDKHLEYYFASKKNREILIKTKVVNRKNEILDRDLKKMIEYGHLSISNKFRLKPSRPKIDPAKRYQSIDPKEETLNKTVGKQQFQQFLEKQRNQIRNKTMIARTNPPTQDITHEDNQIKLFGEQPEANHPTVD